MPIDTFKAARRLQEDDPFSPESTTIRTLVGAVAAVGAILAVMIPLAIYRIG